MKRITNLTLIGILVLVTLFFNSCSENKKENKSLPVIDIEANINNMQVVNLSQFTDHIQYLILENVDNMPLIGLNHIDVSGNLILVDNGNICMLYDSAGHFLSKIGAQGRGPGEYRAVFDIGFGNNQKIYTSFPDDLFEYNKDGIFINKYTRSLLVDNKYLLKTWHIVNDSLFFGHIPNTTGQLEYRAVLTDKNGNVRKYYKNYDLFIRESLATNMMESYSNAYLFQGLIYYNEMYCDTLFSLDDRYELIPRYIFNLGKFKEPLSARKTADWSDLGDYIYIWDVFQTDNYIFLKCAFGNKFLAKRLTPKLSMFP